MIPPDLGSLSVCSFHCTRADADCPDRPPACGREGEGNAINGIHKFAAVVSDDWGCRLKPDPGSLRVRCAPRHPKDRIRQTESERQNPTDGIRKTESETQNPTDGIRDTESERRNPRHRIRIWSTRHGVRHTPSKTRRPEHVQNKEREKKGNE